MPLNVQSAALLFLVLTAGTDCLAQQVGFATSVHPILAAKCSPCHSGENPRAGLSFASRDTLMKGGKSGPAIVPGKSSDSLLIARITGRSLPAMPMGGPRLTDGEIKLPTGLTRMPHGRTSARNRQPRGFLCWRRAVLNYRKPLLRIPSTSSSTVTSGAGTFLFRSQCPMTYSSAEFTWTSGELYPQPLR